MRKTLFVILLISHSAFSQVTGNCPPAPYELKSPENYEHLKYAPEPIERLFDAGPFVASVDSPDDDDNNDRQPDALIQPNFVATHIKNYPAKRGSNYPPSFRPPETIYDVPMFDLERRLTKRFTSIGIAYSSQTAWVPLQLSPRSTANRINSFYGCNTHAAPNYVPANPQLANGIWQAADNLAASIAQHYGDAWDVSGPIYLESSDDLLLTENPSMLPIRVPDAIFKIILFEMPGQGVGIYSLVYPNRFTSTPSEFKKGLCSADKVYDHSPFIVSLKAIESLTKLTFFPEYATQFDQVKISKAGALPALNESDWVGYCR